MLIHFIRNVENISLKCNFSELRKQLVLKMRKIKSALIIYSTLFCLNLEAYSRTLRKNWTAIYWYYDPKIISVNNSLLTIGVENKSIVISPTERSDQFRTCKLPLLPATLYSENEYAYVLGNGKIVLAVTVYSLFLDFDDYSNLYVIVDPLTCSSTKPIETYLGQTRRLEAVVPYHDSFDIFYKSSHEHWLNKSTVPKTPLRYNDLGEQIELDYFFDLETEIKSLQIQTIKSYDPSEGYLCTVGIGDGNVTLKRIDSQFKTLKQMEVVIEDLQSVSLTHGRISYCHNTITDIGAHTYWTYLGHLNKTCEFLDADLHRQAMINYDQLQLFESEILRGRLETIPTNLSGGDAVILQSYYTNQPDNNNSSLIYYYLDRVYVNGTTKLIERSKFNVLRNEQHYSIDFGMYDGDFCSIIREGFIPTHVNTTCINLAPELSR